MVSFNFLAAAFAAFAVVSEGAYHGHMAKRHLNMRASYGNITDVFHPSIIGTGSSAPASVTTAPVADTPEPDYTTTITSTETKCLTITYTLGGGKEVVTTVTQYEPTTKTIAHVKATLTVAPVIESTPGVSSVSASPTVAPVVSNAVPSSSESARTSTTTLYVTAPASGTHTAVPGSVTPACPSVETVYLPTYITVYNTVTAGPPVSSTQSTTSRTTTRTSTTTISVFKTVTLASPPRSYK